MDEHPNEWWQVTLSDDGCFRVDDANGRLIQQALREGFASDTTLDIVDLYGDEATIVLRHVTDIFHCGYQGRALARMRAVLLNREDEEFAKEHAKPEWET